MRSAQKIMTGLLLAFFAGGMFLSLFFMSSWMGEEAPMDSGCPFMEHGEAFCPMDLMAHIGAWQDTYEAIVPSVVWLIVAVGLLAAAISLSPNFFLLPRYSIPIYLKRVSERSDIFIFKFWQELFSKGILNPKLF